MSSVGSIGTNTYNSYDTSASAKDNAQAMINNQNANYATFMANLPQYQNNMNNQTIDAGNSQYQNQKQSIDENANSRGLLFSGMKTGAEQSAANKAASDTSSKIASNNKNLADYANNYGNQVVQSNLANYQSQVDEAMKQYQKDQASYSQNQQRTSSFISGIGNVLGSVASVANIFSDEKLKSGVKNADKDAQDLIDNLKSKRFSYKDDPSNSEQLGILAQDMEKSPMGKAIVIETPRGKALDIPKTLSAILAVQSVINKRLKKAGA